MCGVHPRIRRSNCKDRASLRRFTEASPASVASIPSARSPYDVVPGVGIVGAGTESGAGAHIGVVTGIGHDGGVSTLRERYADVGGHRLRYLTGGEGKPLVLCHGFLSSAEEFGGRFRALARERTLIVPDLPGNALSAPLRGRHTAEALAESVDDLLVQLRIDAFDLGGLCLGAAVACALARRRGDAVGRLVLHTPLLMPRLVRARHRYQAHALTLPGIWQGVGWLSRRRTISDLYKKYVIQEGPVDRHTSDVNFENQRRADLRAAKEWLRDALQRDDLAVITERTAPTLIIVAGNDRLVNVQSLRRLIEGLPGVTIHVDEDGGHGWSEAAVQRQLAVLLPFFADPAEHQAGNGERHAGGHQP